MKYLIYIVIAGTIALFSCSNPIKEKVDEAKETLEELEKATGSEVTSEEIKDCDDFLEKYEVWILDYIELLSEYTKNPTDVTLMQKYMKVAAEAATWYTQWATLAACSVDEEYQKKFDEISKKADEKMKELGLE